MKMKEKAVVYYVKLHGLAEDAPLSEEHMVFINCFIGDNGFNSLPELLKWVNVPIKEVFPSEIAKVMRACKVYSELLSLLRFRLEQPVLQVYKIEYEGTEE